MKQIGVPLNWGWSFIRGIDFLTVTSECSVERWRGNLDYTPVNELEDPSPLSLRAQKRSGFNKRQKKNYLLGYVVLNRLWGFKPQNSLGLGGFQTAGRGYGRIRKNSFVHSMPRGFRLHKGAHRSRSYSQKGGLQKKGRRILFWCHPYYRSWCSNKLTRARDGGISGALLLRCRRGAAEGVTFSFWSKKQ